jgi:hypothetical protein
MVGIADGRSDIAAESGGTRTARTVVKTRYQKDTEEL